MRILDNVLNNAASAVARKVERDVSKPLEAHAQAIENLASAIRVLSVTVLAATWVVSVAYWHSTRGK